MIEISKDENDSEEKRKWFEVLIAENNKNIALCPCGLAFSADSIDEHYLHSKTNNLALHLRFVLLGDATVMQVLCCITPALGVTDGRLHSYLSSSGFLVESAHCNAPVLSKKSLLLAYDRIKNPPVCPPVEDNLPSFERVQHALSEFVENNCFFGKEKPVPRLEQIENSKDWLLVTGEKGYNANFHIPAEMFKYLQIVYENKSVPVYKTVAFRSEWTKIFPREFSKADYLSDLTVSNLYTDGVGDAMNFVNQANRKADIEIYEFRIWKN